jgi:F-type H+-transporting ATPase subunit delta
MAKKFPLQYAKILYDLTEDIEDDQTLQQGLKQYIEYLHDKQALHQIDYIIDEYKGLKRKEQGEEELQITIARDIDKNIIEQIKQSFSADQAEVEQDKSILGGIIIRRGNTVIDGSVKKQLNKLKQNLLN